MKHFINIFITLILLGMALGITYLVEESHAGKGEISGWVILYAPVFMFMCFWGDKLIKDYK